MIDTDFKFREGELVIIRQRYPYGYCGIVISRNAYEMTGEGGWQTCDYQVLTAQGEIINISESALQKLD